MDAKTADALDWITGDDTRFDPWRVPASPTMAEIVESAIQEALAFETAAGRRKRTRRPADLASFKATVTALVCDLAFHHVMNRKGAIGVSRSNVHLGKRWRYRPDVLTVTLPAILDLLAAPALQFLRQLPGHAGVYGRQTKIAPGAALMKRLEGLGPDDIGRQYRGEVIWLRATAEDEDQGEIIDYEDTPETARYRAEMRTLNARIAAADISFDDSILGPTEAIPDLTDRSMRRIFTHGSFESGGRLANGFWLSMKNVRRLEGLAIDGEEVVRADYGQIGPRIAYALAEAIAPQGDLYDVPGLSGCREGVKKVINAALFATKPLSRHPRGTAERLPEGPFEGIMAAIQRAHPALASVFSVGIGHRVQFIESQVLLRALAILGDQGVTGLPVHDAIIAPRGRVGDVEKAMKGAFREVVGGDIPVTIDAWSQSQGRVAPMKKPLNKGLIIGWSVSHQAHQSL